MTDPDLRQPISDRVARSAAELVIRNSKILSHTDLKAVVDLFNERKIDPSLLVTHFFKFSEYGEAIRAVRSGQALKVLLSW